MNRMWGGDERKHINEHKKPRRAGIPQVGASDECGASDGCRALGGHAEQREKGAAKLNKAAAALLDYACGVPHSEQNLPVLVAPQLEQVH